MSETLQDEITDIDFKSDLFAKSPTGADGEAGQAEDWQDAADIADEVLQHSNWPAEEAGRLLLGLSSDSTSREVNYGYSVYSALRAEETIDQAVYLDSRVFLDNTNLLNVMEEAIKCATAYNDKRLIQPLVKGMLDTAYTFHIQGRELEKYMETIIGTNSTDAITEYVQYMSINTLKTSPDAKVFLKQMAHSIQAMPIEVRRPHGNVSETDKQVWLEEIGMAWIRKRWSVTEIDFLP